MYNEPSLHSPILWREGSSIALNSEGSYFAEEVYVNERERIKRWEEKEDLIDEIKSVLGHEPQGMRQFLALMTHPDLVDHVASYFKLLSNQAGKHACQLYEAPWDCAREAEAKYETIKYGWLGAGSGVGFDESWCEPCRQRVLTGSLD